MPTTASEWEEWLSDLAPGMADIVREGSTEALTKRAARDSKLAATIRNGHATQFDAIDQIVFGMEQAAVQMLDRIGFVKEDDHTPVRSALVLLQSAATMTIREITLLASQGYWVAGAARWRALHELAVSARLIAEGGPSIAQRYLDHGFVVQTRRALAYRDAHDAGPVTAVELNERARQADALETTHAIANSGSRFRDAYGWALPMLETTAKGSIPRPTFDVLERRAGAEVRRLLVVSAHGLVHLDAAGVRTAVLMDEGYSLGPIEHFTKAVLQPTLDSIIRLVAATHLAFEPDLESQFARLTAAQGSGLIKIAADALHAFGTDDVQDNESAAAQT